MKEQRPTGDGVEGRIDPLRRRLQLGRWVGGLAPRPPPLHPPPWVRRVRGFPSTRIFSPPLYPHGCA